MRKFTLLELIIVIGIIAVLASLLMPALSAAKEKAKIATELNSRQQLAKYCHLYAKDYNAKFPDVRYTRALHNLVPNNHQNMYKMLMPYSQRSGSVYDHNLNQKIFVNLFFCQSTLLNERNSDSYGYDNGRFATVSFYVIPNRGTHYIDDFRYTSLFDASPEKAMWSCVNLTKYGDWFAHNRPIMTSPPKGTSTSFVDGSAKWMPEDSLQLLFKDRWDLFFYVPIND